MTVSPLLKHGTSRQSRVWWPLLVVLGLAIIAQPAQGKERVQDFLTALLDGQHFDVAEEYLESLANDPAAPEDLKQALDYHLGTTILSKSALIRDNAARSRELEKARAKLEEFITKFPMHSLALEARAQLAGVGNSRANNILEQANKPANAAKKDALLAEARAEFEKAQALFEGLEKDIDADYQKRKEEVATSEREAMLGRLLQARLSTAINWYEQAAVHPADSQPAKDLLAKAAAKFHQLYEKFRKRPVSSIGAYYEGRCHQALGDLKKAMTLYNDLQLQPDEPPIVREQKGRGMAQWLEILNSESEKQYDVVLQKGEEWLKAAKAGEEQRDFTLLIRYQLAVALDHQIAALQSAGGDDKEVKKKVKVLLDHANIVGRSASDKRLAAKDLAKKHQATDQAGEPETFAEAKEAAQSAITAMSQAENNIKVIKATNNQELLPQIPQKEQEAREQRALAIKYCQLALSLKDTDLEGDGKADEEELEKIAKTRIAEVNVLRSQFAYLLLQADKNEEAAVIGEFLARRYPDMGVAARQAGLIAVFGHLKARETSQPAQQAFETQRIKDLVEYMAKTWPNEGEVDVARMTLADLYIRSDDLLSAAEILRSIPAESPRRDEADLKAGQVLWQSYVRAMHLPEDERPPKAELDQRPGEALKVLEGAVTRMREKIVDVSQVTAQLLSAELALAQIYVQTGASAKGLAVLERPDTGLLALAAAKSPQVSETNAESAYSSALQAYVATQQLEKAEAMMSALEAMVAGKPDAAAQLTQKYLRLGKELEERVERLRTAGQAQELGAVVQGFESFLTRISQRDSGNTFNSLNWVAETFLRLASGLDSGDNPSAEAKGYYKKAADTYKKMADKGKSDPKFLPTPQAALGLNLRIARCQRSLGDYKGALDLLQAILNENSKVLEAHLEASHTYQAWAAAEKKPAHYINAMQGGRKDPKTKANIFWGWGKIATMVQRNPKYSALYHECRYNLAECMLRLGELQQPPEKEKTWDSGQRVIVSTYKLNPTMGGPEQLAKYNSLLKKFQIVLKQPQVKLENMETAGANITPAKGS